MIMGTLLARLLYKSEGYHGYVPAERELGQQIASPPVKRVTSARSRRRSVTSHSTKEGNGVFSGGKISSGA